MPSDERVQLALRATAPRRAAYRATVSASLARVRAVLAASHGVDRARQELGVFGAARIDAEQFAGLSHGVTLDATTRARVARAADILHNCVEASDSEYAISVDDGHSVYAAISGALGDWGRAFGSSLTVDLVRIGQYVPATHDRLTEVWRFEQWSKAHRLSAPPIVVDVAGSDFRVAELSDFLDGSQHIVLVVDGPCPPASLVRHITPGTLVLQTSDERGLDRFAAYQGPAIAALVPDGAACFLHDPDRGTAPWQRLSIWKRPEFRSRATLGGISPAQQREELLQLEALAVQPSFPTTAIDALAPSGTGDAADRLASWLLAETTSGT